MTESTGDTLYAGQYRAALEAVDYIKRYKLADGVSEVIGRMREFLPSMADLRIDLFVDPDCDCEPELRLYALFPAGTDEDTIDEQLDHFDDAWWLDNCDRWDYRIEVHTGSV